MLACPCAVVCVCAGDAVAAPASAQDGAALYAQRCASCHEGGQVARAPARDVIAALPPDRIVARARDRHDARAGRDADAGAAARDRRTTCRPRGRPARRPRRRPVAPRCEAAAPFRATGRRDWRAWGVTPANDRFQRAAGVLRGAGAEPETEMGVRLRRRERRGRQPDDRRRSRVRRQRVGPRLRARPEGRLRALDVQGRRRRAGRDHRSASSRNGSTVGLLRRHPRAIVYSVDAATGAAAVEEEDRRRTAPRASPARRCCTAAACTCRCRRSRKASARSATYECCTFRGSIVALDPATGEQLWRTYMITETPTPRAKNAKGTQLWGPSGAAVWSAPTIDPATEVALRRDRRRLLAAGRADDRRDRRARSRDRRDQVGDPDDRGRRVHDGVRHRRHDQLPGEGGPGSRLRPVADPRRRCAGGKRADRRGQKSGVVHGFDPDQRGKKLWSTTVGRGGELGGIEWGSASDGTNMYVPLSDITFKEPAQRQRGGLNPRSRRRPVRASGSTDGKQAWLSRPNGCGDKPSCSPALSAPAAAIPGAVFGGSIDGHFRAFADQRRPRALGLRHRARLRHGERRQGARRIDRRRRRRRSPTAWSLTTSGYGQWGGMRGNVLLVFSVDGRYDVNAENAELAEQVSLRFCEFSVDVSAPAASSSRSCRRRARC